MPFTIKNENVICPFMPKKTMNKTNKKDMVIETLKEKKILVCCLQETKIPINFRENILNCGGYNLELEMNDNEKRSGIYITRQVYNLFQDLWNRFMVQKCVQKMFKKITATQNFRTDFGNSVLRPVFHR